MSFAWAGGSQHSGLCARHARPMTANEAFIANLGVDRVNDVMTHPLHQANCRALADLIAELHAARSFVDFDELQRRLFQCVYKLEQYQHEVHRNQTRLARHRQPVKTEVLAPPSGDVSDPLTWDLEDLVLDRALVQLRTVGDGLAWKASDYDRRYVQALCNNNSAGPMQGKEGLDYEIGASVEARIRGNFGLLHDLTNCLRIGDMTEFYLDGSKLVYEIKKSATARAGKQRRRIAAAIEAVMNGGELPGSPGSAFVVPTDRCRTHIGTFQRLIREAQQHGAAAVAVPGGRAALAVSGVVPGAAMTQESIDAMRLSAFRDAGIDAALHHVRWTSAHRNFSFMPSVMPFTLYPIAPQDAAFLICDYVVVSAFLDTAALTKVLERRGLATEVPLKLQNDTLDETDVVLRATNGTRTVSFGPGGFIEVLLEFLDLATWADAIVDVLATDRSPEHPIPAFRTTRVWR